MGKRIVSLTVSELREKVYEAVLPVLNENDAASYSRVHRATKQAKLDNQNSKSIHQINPHKQEADKDIIAHGVDLEPHAEESIIDPYKDVRFMFYCKNLRQNTGIVLFSLSRLYELTREIAILTGDIVFNNQQMSGSIIINMDTASVVYCHISSRKRYPLEIDNRFAPQWNSLVSELQKASRMI